MNEAYDDRDGWIWMDGKLVAWRKAQVHVLTHAMHYASAVFEGERAYDGKIFLARRHGERLHFSAGQLDFDIPYSVDQIETAKAELLAANGLRDAYVRCLAWRGAGPDMGVGAARNPVHLAIAAWEWPRYYEKVVQLDIAKWKRPSPETIPVHAKAAGLYMICTISRHAAANNGYKDALFLDHRGHVAEATGANIFFTKGDEVHTPKPDCFLNGLTRQTVIEMLKSRAIKVHERTIMPDELGSFDECWLTGTAAEITPVDRIADHTFKVGATSRMVAADYEARVRA